jgi:hypothetical protein
LVLLGVGSRALRLSLANDNDAGPSSYVLGIFLLKPASTFQAATTAIVSPEQQQGGTILQEVVQAYKLPGAILEFKVWSIVTYLRRKGRPT